MVYTSSISQKYVILCTASGVYNYLHKKAQKSLDLKVLCAQDFADIELVGWITFFWALLSRNQITTSY